MFVMNARAQQHATRRVGASVGATLVLLQFAVVAMMLVMGQVDWERTMATAPQPVGSAEASQGPAVYAADVAGEAARAETAPVPPALERVAPIGTTAAAAASVTLPLRQAHPPAAEPPAVESPAAEPVSAERLPAEPLPAEPLSTEPLAVVAADLVSPMPLRAVRLEPAAEVGVPATEDRIIAVDQSGIPLPPPAD